MSRAVKARATTRLRDLCAMRPAQAPHTQAISPTSESLPNTVHHPQSAAPEIGAHHTGRYPDGPDNQVTREEGGTQSEHEARPLQGGAQSQVGRAPGLLARRHAHCEQQGERGQDERQEPQRAPGDESTGSIEGLRITQDRFQREGHRLHARSEAGGLLGRPCLGDEEDGDEGHDGRHSDGPAEHRPPFATQPQAERRRHPDTPEPVSGPSAS